MAAGKLEATPVGPAEQPSPRGGGVVFRDLQDALRLHRWLVALCAAAGLLAGLLVFLLATKMYHAEVLVIPADDETQSGSSLLSGQLGGLAEMAGLNLGSSSNTWAGIATLQSRALADQFISSKNLMPELFHDDWDQARNRWKPDVEQAPPTQWDAYDLFDKKVRTVDYNSTTQLVTIAMDWRDPVAAAAWANDYVRLANELLRQTAIKEAQSSVEVLRSEVAKADTVDLQQAIYRLIESNISRATLARVREEYAFKVIDRAVPSDPDEYVWPRPEIVIPVGLVLGFTLGFGIAVLRVVWSRTH